MIPHSTPYIKSEDKEAVLKQLESGFIAHGEKVREFENLLCNYLKVNYALTTVSGTSALTIAMKSLGINHKDEVILPTYVCKSVAEAVSGVGATPVFCDVNEQWCMDYHTIKERVTLKTKAIILVHTFGIYSYPDEISAFQIPVIEDFCQAFGAGINNHSSSLKGDIGIYSFHATKCLTTGEGGAMAANIGMYYEKASSFRSKNSPPSKMSDLQAALGISQLLQYPEMLERRKKIAEKYLDSLNPGYLNNTKIISDKSMFFRFPVTVQKSIDSLINDFNSNGIAVRKGVDSLLHRIYGENDKRYPGAVKKIESTLSLPIYPGLEFEDLKQIIQLVNSIK